MRTEDVIPILEERRREGSTYGDFQYMTDESSKDFMARGIMSTYSPIDSQESIPQDQLGLTLEDWMRLYVLAHTDKARAYDEYAAHYLQTDGQIYWSDDHQFSPYLPEAGEMLAEQTGLGDIRVLDDHGIVRAEIQIPGFHARGATVAPRHRRQTSSMALCGSSNRRTRLS